MLTSKYLNTIYSIYKNLSSHLQTAAASLSRSTFPMSNPPISGEILGDFYLAFVFASYHATGSYNLLPVFGKQYQVFVKGRFIAIYNMLGRFIPQARSSFVNAIYFQSPCLCIYNTILYLPFFSSMVYFLVITT